MKKLLTFVLALLLAAAACPQSAFATPMGGVEITSYNVNIAVSEYDDSKVVYEVEEIITVDFSTSMKGIYRYLSTDDTHAVSDINVEGHPFTVEETGDGVNISIGSDAYVTGQVTYPISYNMEITDGLDEVDYYLIGTGWSVFINGVTFSMTLPRKFDSGAVDFDLGPDGSAGYPAGDIDFSVSGSTVSGGVTRELKPYEGLRMRIALPEGYFSAPEFELPAWMQSLLLDMLSKLLM